MSDTDAPRPDMTQSAAETQARRDEMAMPSSMPPGMRVELMRARIRRGRESRTDEWMAMLNDRYDECVATLAGERMAFESIFRHIDSDGTHWLYHLAVYGSGGGVLDEHSGPLDADHAAFSRECKEPGWQLLTPAHFIAPDSVRAAMLAASAPHGPTTESPPEG